MKGINLHPSGKGDPKSLLEKARGKLLIVSPPNPGFWLDFKLQSQARLQPKPSLANPGTQDYLGIKDKDRGEELCSLLEMCLAAGGTDFIVLAQQEGGFIYYPSFPWLQGCSCQGKASSSLAHGSK